VIHIAAVCGHIILLKENGRSDFRSCILFILLCLVPPSTCINVSFNQQSRAHPREIMIEVLKALQELNVSWKKNGHYNMKCRWCPGFSEAHDMLDASNSFDSIIMHNDDANGKLPAVIKFEIQVCSSLLH
jgi:hypothetical protein